MEFAPEPEYGIAPPDHRLPGRTHVGRVQLQVSDLDRSTAYYRDVLGLRIARSDKATAALVPLDSDTVLVELRERRDARPVPPDGLLGLYHFAILLPDRAALGRFAGHLQALGQRFASADHLVSEALYLWDPDGLGIEVYADRPRATWRAHGRELSMGTERLDLRALTAEAAGVPWRGMPDGTVMGHVHLSVGDLAAARRFYHLSLGLDATVWSYPGALFLSAGGYHHHLGLNTWAAGARPASDEDARLLEWELVVPSPTAVPAAAASLRGAGYDVDVDEAGAVITDPWGTRCRLRAAGGAASLT